MIDAHLECLGVLIHKLTRNIHKQRRCLTRQKTGVPPLSQHLSTLVITEDFSPAHGGGTLNMTKKKLKNIQLQSLKNIQLQNL